MPNLALQANYTYTRTTNLIGDFTNFYTPWVGLTIANYLAGPVLSGTLPDGSKYSVPTFLRNPALVAANGNSRMLTNNPSDYTDYDALAQNLSPRIVRIGVVVGF